MTISIETNVPSKLDNRLTFAHDGGTQVGRYVVVKVTGHPTVLLRPVDAGGVTIWHYIKWDGTPSTTLLQYAAVCDALGIPSLPNWGSRA